MANCYKVIPSRAFIGDYIGSFQIKKHKMNLICLTMYFHENDFKEIMK